MKQKGYTAEQVKLPTLRATLPGKVMSFYIVPIASLKGEACGALAGHREAGRPQVLLGQGAQWVKRATSSGLGSRPAIVGYEIVEVAANKRGCEVCPKRLVSSCCTSARMQQKEKELQIVFCSSLIVWKERCQA